ncbi:MAG: D-aminoacyl-tRNA deacylase [Thiotrichales bacterium]|nr:D-aminoacyl-tRNA deacylase [Thiotrichales bacterium]
MIGLLQRVSSARVEVDNCNIAEIGTGLLVLTGIEKTDTEKTADRLLERLLSYRVFADAGGKMNLSVQQIGGGLLLVPQFTLPADTRKGTRPSFSSAADPDQGKRLFDYLCDRAVQAHPGTCCGRFGADMQVSLTNNGPVTFWLQTHNY